VKKVKVVKRKVGRPRKNESYNYYYIDMSDFLNEYSDDFKNERSDVRAMISKILTMPQKHRNNKEIYAISNNFLTFIGSTKKTFDKINLKYGLFTTDNRYRIGYYCCGYEMTSFSKQLISEFVKYEDRGVIKKVKHSRYIYENVAKYDDSVFEFTEGVMKVNQNIKVNAEGLHKYLDEGNTVRLSEASRWAAALNNTNYPENVVPQTYTQLEFGRVVGQGLTMQSTSKTLRKILMDGYYDYDFKNCHYAIVNSLGVYPTIQMYVDNTEEVREDLADEIGVTKEMVKQGLISLLYGANEKTHPDYSSIYDLFGERAANDFWNHYFIKNLVNEIEQCRTDISHEYAGFNKMTNSEFARFIMGWENDILCCAVEGKVIDVPMYDGFISREDLDVEQMEKKVSDELGIDITIKKEKLISPV
jgi:hypothetical protein